MRRTSGLMPPIMPPRAVPAPGAGPNQPVHGSVGTTVTVDWKTG